MKKPKVVFKLAKSKTAKRSPGSAASEEFWLWFAREEVRLATEMQRRAALPRATLLEIQQHLAPFHPGIIGELALAQLADGRPCTLVITADGNKKAFPFVKSLVAAAPKLKQWKVVAFRQRASPRVRIDLGVLKTKQEDFFFRELGRADGKVHIEVLIKGMNAASFETIVMATFLRLDHLVGEYDVETKLGAILIHPLQETSGDDVKPLSELVALVDSITGVSA